MSIIGNKTIQYSVFDRTDGWTQSVGDTTSYKRPSLELLTDTLSGGGIMGEIDMPSLGQLGSMEIELSFKKTNTEAVRLFRQKTHTIEVRWINDAIDTSSGSIFTGVNKEIMRVIPKALDPGKVETNSPNDASMKFEVIYYQYIQGGEILIEIDKLNGVLTVMGVDYAAPIREAL